MSNGPQHPEHDIRSRFDEDGYVSPLNILSAEEASRVKSELEAVEASRGGRLSLILNAKGHLLLPFLWELIHDERILAPVRAMLGEDVLCWGSSFFSKDPSSDDDVPLHQDCTCWGLSEPEGLTAWLALTPSTQVTGCLRVVPGSHKEALRHVVRGRKTSMLPLGEELDVSFDDTAFEECHLAPGQMSLHHALLVHGSRPNRSETERRIGFAIRYIPGHLHQVGDRKGHATLVSGRDHGTFNLESRPEAPFDDAALKRHRKIISDSTRLVMAEAKRLPRDVPAPG